MSCLTASQQDYLEAIYDLYKKNGTVRSIDIANTFSFSRASVSRAISILKQDGYISQQPYGNIFLTDKGLYEAQNVRKCHDLLKYYLVNILEVATEIAEEDACRMEHIISSETLSQIEKKASEHIAKNA